MRAGAWSSLSVTLMTRYESTPDPAVLDEAIVALDQARRLMRADNPERAGVVSTLGGALLQKSGLTDDAGLLDEAVMHLEAALRATPATDPALFERQFNLAMAKLRHGQLTGNAASVSDALELLRRAHDGSPADHRVRAVAAQLLASADRADEDSPALTDDPPEDLDLAVALHTEFERSGYLPHLHRSIDILRTHLEGRRLEVCPGNRLCTPWPPHSGRCTNAPAASQRSMKPSSCSRLRSKKKEATAHNGSPPGPTARLS